MLINCQRRSSNEPASELNNQNLDHNGEEFNGNEEPIIEEALENIKFFLLKFPAIYFIEHLHEDKNLEENSVMYSDIRVPWARFASQTGWHIEDHRALEENYSQNDDLEQTLSEYVSPHIRSNN